MSETGTKMKIETIRDLRRDALGKDPARAAGEAALVRLATRLYELRTSMRLTQEQVAERAGLDQASISDIENGDANPTVRTLGRLAAGLGVNAGALLEHSPLADRAAATPGEETPLPQGLAKIRQPSREAKKRAKTRT
jgi:transcriptional regulator with XRE-family HTH domain